MASRTIWRAAVISPVVAFSADTYGERRAVVAAVVVARWTRWSAAWCPMDLDKEGRIWMTRHAQNRIVDKVKRRIMLKESTDVTTAAKFQNLWYWYFDEDVIVLLWGLIIPVAQFSRTETFCRSATSHPLQS
jgi:hypothetical protein